MERSVGRVCEQVHLDARRDELVLEAEGLDRRQEDAVPSAPYAWGAWDDVRQDVMADAAPPLLLPDLADEDAGKLAARARGVPVADASFPQERLPGRSVPEAQDAAAELYKLAEAPSAGQSCAEQGLAAVRQFVAPMGPLELLDAPLSEPAAGPVRMAQRTPSPQAHSVPQAVPQQTVAPEAERPDEPRELTQRVRKAQQAARPQLQASLQPAEQPRAAREPLALLVLRPEPVERELPLLVQPALQPEAQSLVAAQPVERQAEPVAQRQLPSSA